MKKGFGLIEVLVAATVLGFILLGMAAGFFSSFVFIDEAREISIATTAAQQEIESIRDMDFDNILAHGSTFTAPGLALLDHGAGTVTIDNPLGANDIRRVTGHRCMDIAQREEHEPQPCHPGDPQRDKPEIAECR